MFIGNLYLSCYASKELMYITGESGQSRRYHLFNIGFDNFCKNDKKGTGWVFNVTIPFVSFNIGWVFLNNHR